MRSFIMRNERSVMKNRTVELVLLGLMTGASIAQAAEVTPLMSKELTDIPGREVLMITVEKAPGWYRSRPTQDLFPLLAARTDAHAFIYVLEGSIVMQVGGEKEVTLTPGQTWYEGPNDFHVVGRNASSTKPVKFLVFLVKDKAASY
jgi:mannose-6-phosphate isomerase-like protein (cupin superfamily)